MKIQYIHLVLLIIVSSFVCNSHSITIVGRVHVIPIITRFSTSQYCNSNNNSIEYYPWNDGLDFSLLCTKLVSALKSNNGPVIIHNGTSGGLTHKFQLLLQDITLALVLHRKLYLNMLDTFWNNHDSCLKELKYSKKIEGITVCEKGRKCLNLSRNIYSLIKRDIIMNDYRISPSYIFSEITMKKLNNLHLFSTGINKSRFIQVIYRLLSNPNKELLHIILQDLKQMDFQHSVVGIHIRSGGFLANYRERAYWITEKQLPIIPAFLRNLIKKESLSTVFYLTSDSNLVEKYVKNSLRNFTFLSNTRFPKIHTTTLSKDFAFKGAFYDLLVTSQSSAIVYSQGSGYSEAICILSNTTKLYKLPTKMKKYE